MKQVLVPGFGEGLVPDGVDQLTALQVLTLSINIPTHKLKKVTFVAVPLRKQKSYFWGLRSYELHYFVPRHNLFWCPQEIEINSNCSPQKYEIPMF